MSNLSTYTDEELAGLSVSDTAYFGELIKRYSKILMHYIMRRSHANKEDAEDILQNSFIKMYRNINDFDTTLSFSSWSYRITHNETIDWYRKKKSRPQLFIPTSDENIFDSIASDIDIKKEIEYKEIRKEIKEIIQTLDQKYQEIISLRFFEDKNYDEISDILKIPSGTVAIRLSRAKKLLKEKLQTYL